MSDRILIRGEYRVSGLYRDLTSSPFAFDLGGPHEIQVEFRPTEEEDGNNAWAKVTATWSANEKVMAAFETMAEGGIPEGSKESERWEMQYLDEDGEIPPSKAYPGSLLPEPVQSYCRSVRAEVREALDGLVELMRWRYGLEMAHDPVRPRSIVPKWSLDGEEWRPLPVKLSMEVEISQPLEIDRGRRQQVMELREEGKAEPLGHLLLREAREVKGSHPRSALVIGMAALENGLKDFMVRVDPSEGLRRVLERLPAPSVATFLTAILPGLPTFRGSERDPVTFPDLPESLKKTIQKANGARNRVVHVWTSETVNRGLVERSLEAIRDLLYLMDYYSGEARAG